MIYSIPEIKRILYATDLSENAMYAFGVAAGLANRHEAKITILHVLEEPPPKTKLVLDVMQHESWEEIIRKRETELIQAIRQRINEFCIEFGNRFPECPFVMEDVRVETGHPVEKILQVAADISCDLIVMGSRGHSLLKDVVMGSTSSRVLRRSRKPVLIVPLP